MKKCGRCGQQKEDEEFNWKIKPFKRHSVCRTCQNEYRRDWYLGHTEEVKQEAVRHTRQTRDDLRHYVYEYLKIHPCELCGESDPLVLTFDHVRGRKSKSISDMVRDRASIEDIDAEITKCRVLCASCHMREEKIKRNTKYWLF